MQRTGLVTIGQAPRNDILDSMLPAAFHQLVLQYGALDDLGQDEVEQLGPAPGETPFVTRLADESEVLVSKSAIMPRVQSAVDLAVADGASSVVILCTGAFPDLTAATPLVFPDRVLLANVNALLDNGSLGVIMPHEDQMDLMRSKWTTQRRRFLGASASPYTSADALVDVSRELERDGANMIVLDCMGFTSEMKETVARSVNMPVILANRLVGRVLEELIGEPSSIWTDAAATD